MAYNTCHEENEAENMCGTIADDNILTHVANRTLLG